MAGITSGTTYDFGMFGTSNAAGAGGGMSCGASGASMVGIPCQWHARCQAIYVVAAGGGGMSSSESSHLQERFFDLGHLHAGDGDNLQRHGTVD